MDKATISRESLSTADDTTIEFSHYQALYMFYLAMGSFGIIASQYKRFSDAIEDGTIVEPIYSTK